MCALNLPKKYTILELQQCYCQYKCIHSIYFVCKYSAFVYAWGMYFDLFWIVEWLVKRYIQQTFSRFIQSMTVARQMFNADIEHLFRKNPLTYSNSFQHSGRCWGKLSRYVYWMYIVLTLIAQTSAHYRYQYSSCLRLILFFGGDKKVVFNIIQYFKKFRKDSWEKKSHIMAHCDIYV